MENRRFSVFETAAYALKTVFDHVSLFFYAIFAQLAIFVISFGLFVLYTVDMFKKVWGQGPRFLDLFNTMSFESFKSTWEQLWGTVSGLLTQYAILFVVFGLLLMFVAIGLYLGFIRLVFRLHDTGSSSVGLLFSCFCLAPKAIVSMIFYCLMVGIGLFLFIFPGIYLMLRGIFFPYFIVDKNAGIIDSIKKSFDITCGHVWSLFALTMVAPLTFKLGLA